MSPVEQLQIAAGDLLGGKYRIGARLGEGGMGAVFAAENIDIGRRVAIKVLHPDYASDQDLAARFRQEARAAAAIGHPGIVDVLDLGVTESGSTYIVMERLDGETLGGRVAREGRLPVAEAVRVVDAVLDALAAAHAAGIIHRDLKPDNVFLPARGPVAAKLLDFGISKFAGGDGDVALTQSGVVMGTPLYMSPEQARGERAIGAATDIYAVGAILYEALAGRPPFHGRSYNEVIARVMMEPHPPLGSKRPETPPALCALVDAMLAKDPAERPAGADSARRALRRIAGLDGAPPEAELRVTRGSDAQRPRRRALIAAMVACASALAGGAAAWIHWGRPAAIATQAPPQAAPPGGAALPAAVAAPAAPINPPAAEAVVDPAVAQVTVTLEAEPSRARWSLDGIPLDGNPARATRDNRSTHTATATAPGYASESVLVRFDHPHDERLALRPRPAPHGHAAPRVESPRQAPSPSAAPARSPAEGLTIEHKNPFKHD
jgi:hypothetical protein